MIDLTTKYLGFTLKNPLMVSASPLSGDLGNIRRMEDAGAAAVVLPSLFEEQITVESTTLDRFLWLGTDSYAESLSYIPDTTKYSLGPDAYLEHLRRAKQAVEIPVIASLNGTSTGGWLGYAKKIEEAGADALELNIYFIPIFAEMSGGHVEQMYVDLVKQVKAGIHIPVAVKIGPYFSSLPNTARRLDQAGANALVLFNRFYQPDFDLESLDIVPNFILSTPHELLLRLNWVAILYGKLQAALAVTGGVHSGLDVLKSMMAGARVAMMTSALLRHGIGHLATVRTEIFNWMEEHEYESIRQMQGSMSQRAVADPSAFQRLNYMKVLSSYAAKEGVA